MRYDSDSSDESDAPPMSVSESLHYKLRHAPKDEEILTQPEFEGLWDKKQKPYKVTRMQRFLMLFCCLKVVRFSLMTRT